MSQPDDRDRNAPGMPPNNVQVQPLVAAAAAAAAARSLEGVRAYARHVVALLVPGKVSGSLRSDMTRRLAQADWMARQGRPGRIAEDAVVEAFNTLMKQVGDPAGPAIQTDRATAHRMRWSLYNTSPGLSSVDRHRDECLPSETVLLAGMLLKINGRFEPASDQHGVRFDRALHRARRLLSQYVDSHAQQRNAELFEPFRRLLGD